MKNSIIILLISFVFLFSYCKKDDTGNVTPKPNPGSSNSSPSPTAYTDLSGTYSNDGYINGVTFGSVKSDSTTESNSVGSLKVNPDAGNYNQYVFVQTQNNSTISFKVTVTGEYFNFVANTFFIDGVLMQATGLKSYTVGAESYDGWFDPSTKIIYYGIQITQPQSSSIMPVNNSDKL
jgi:hypothetical protein